MGRQPSSVRKHVTERTVYGSQENVAMPKGIFNAKIKYRFAEALRRKEKEEQIVEGFFTPSSIVHIHVYGKIFVVKIPYTSKFLKRIIFLVFTDF